LKIFHIQSTFNILFNNTEFIFFSREVHIDSDDEDQKPSQSQQQQQPPSNKRNPFRDTTSNGKIKLINKIDLIIEKIY